MGTASRAGAFGLRNGPSGATVIAAALSVLLIACGPTPAERPAAVPNPPAPAPPTSQGQKTIIVGQSFEMASLNRVGRNDAELGHVLNAGLVTRDTEKY